MKETIKVLMFAIQFIIEDNINIFDGLVHACVNTYLSEELIFLINRALIEELNSPPQLPHFV